MLMRMLIAAGILCAIAGLPVAWYASHGWIFPDSLSYIDLASDAAHYSPAVLLKNAYWSPLYPALLALAMAVVRPALASELPVFYAVHWLTFVFATACFTLLWATLLRRFRQTNWPELASDSRLQAALIAFGFLLFLVGNLNHTLWYLTPDMLVEGLAYLGAACALRLYEPDAGTRHSAALGIVLGLGYLGKAAMLPMSLLLIAIVFLKPPAKGPMRRHALVALAGLCVTAAPLVTGLSMEKHRFTFGDSGKLNYGYHIGTLPKHSGWIGQDPKDGIPVHPPRKASDKVLLLDFRGPVRGTLPVWSDPSYWWEGVKVRFDARRQFAGFLHPFEKVHSVQAMFLGLLGLLVAGGMLTRRARVALGQGGILNWILLAWPAAGCIMYLMVLFAFRYTAGYVLMLCLGAALAALAPLGTTTRQRVLTALSALLLLSGLALLRPVVRAAIVKPDPNAALTQVDGQDNGASSMAVAQALGGLGIRPGDQLAALGIGLDAYYARLARVRVVAQIWEDADRMEVLPAPEVAQILADLRQVGVKALIARGKRGFQNDEGWVAVPRTDVYIRKL